MMESGHYIGVASSVCGIVGREFLLFFYILLFEESNFTYFCWNRNCGFRLSKTEMMELLSARIFFQ